jgi:transposase
MTSVVTCDVCGGTPCINSTFCRACRRADEKARQRATDPKILRARRLLDDNVSFEAAYHELNRTPGRTPTATVEALMYSLRTRGVAALEEPATKRRLSELSDEQVDEVGARLQRLKPHIARAWTPAEVKQLLRARR